MLNSELAEDGALSIILHGPAWPPSSTATQALNVTLACGEDEKPTIAAHDSESGIMRISWRNKAACVDPRDPPENTTPPPSGDDGPKESTGSGIGWFFFLYAHFEARRRRSDLLTSYFVGY